MQSAKCDVFIEGYCDGAFREVYQAFEANFVTQGETGAAFALFVDGKPVVDLTGGWRDAERRDRWTSDTVVNVWSATKGVAAACFAMLTETHGISYDDRVAAYWPEFATAGKQDVTIGMLLSHQAGLCGFKSPAILHDLLNTQVSAERLALQTPLWLPGSAAGYHVLTFGILATELFRRIDGRPIRQFVEEELRGRRELDITIGLNTTDLGRRAIIIPDLGTDSTGSDKITEIQRVAFANPLLDPQWPNRAEWLNADLSSANGHSNAYAMAKLYAMLIGNREHLVRGKSLLEATRSRFDGFDLVVGSPVRWAAGFMLNSGQYGPNKESFGHGGWGGSFAAADPLRSIAMSYTTNRMCAPSNDRRGPKLIAAVYRTMGQ